MTDNASAHRSAWDAIPWVVNGSANEAQRRLVEAHVAGCGDCRQELAFQRQVHAAMAIDTVAAPDAEPGLQRLWSRIDAEPVVAAEPGIKPAIEPAANRARWLVAAVLVQALGLVGVWAVMRSPAAAPAAYETLSRAAAAPRAVTLRFVPAPSLRMAELQTLLARSGTRIVESSADGGVFGLALAGAETDAPAEARALARALAELRAAPGALLVEPIDARP